MARGGAICMPPRVATTHRPPRPPPHHIRIIRKSAYICMAEARTFVLLLARVVLLPRGLERAGWARSTCQRLFSRVLRVSSHVRKFLLRREGRGKAGEGAWRRGGGWKARDARPRRVGWPGRGIGPASEHRRRHPRRPRSQADGISRIYFYWIILLY